MISNKGGTTMKKLILIVLSIMLVLSFVACEDRVSATEKNKQDTKPVTETLTAKQKTPTDINYSLERYNLIRRAYWVNGQREKANALVCEIEKPLGYVILFSGNVAVGRFVVDGKVSSLNSYLSPDSDYYEIDTGSGYIRDNNWLADVDGTYGTNDSGIFFFTPDGRYIEWTGTYLYSDIPFEISDPVVVYEGK
jgi:hypothetical protein